MRLLASYVDDGALRRQLPSVRVAEELGEGDILDLCGPSAGRAVAGATDRGIGLGKDADGEAVEVLLHVIGGCVTELEFVRYAPGPVVAPPAA